MRIKFIGTADMSSKGVNFIHGFEYEVSAEVYNYLKNTFGNVEALEVVPKVQVKEPEVKPKVNTKVTPKGE